MPYCLKQFSIFVPMKKLDFIVFFLYLTLVFTRCGNHDNLFRPDENNCEDIAFSRLLDSVDNVVNGCYYYDFNDSIIIPALDFYENGDNLRHLWMQAQCNYLIGAILFDKNHVSENATKHLLEALQLLDDNFNSFSDKQISQLYSKIHYINSIIAFNFSNGGAAKRLAKLGLDYSKEANDTVWMALSYYNLVLFYERLGKAGEGDTAYYYYHEGIKLVDNKNYPFVTASLYNAYANCLRHSHQYDSAIIYFDRAISLINNNITLYHKSYLEKGFVNYLKKDYASAISDLKVGFESKDKNIREQSATGLADCYEKMGDSLSAIPYYSLIMDLKAKDVVNKKHNANAITMLDSYLNSIYNQSNNGVGLWVYFIFGTAIVIIVVFYLISRKRHLNTLKDKDLKALNIKISAIYSDKHNNKLDRILTEFHAAYPDSLANLKAAHPDLSDTEINICILSFFAFSLKETATITNLRENTVAKYRTAIKKKLEIDDLKQVFSL